MIKAVLLEEGGQEKCSGRKSDKSSGISSILIAQRKDDLLVGSAIWLRALLIPQIADRIACFIDARSPGCHDSLLICAPLMKLGGGVWGGDVFRGMALNAMIPHGPKDRDSPAPQSAQESLRALQKLR